MSQTYRRIVVTIAIDNQPVLSGATDVAIEDGADIGQKMGIVQHGIEGMLKMVAADVADYSGVDDGMFAKVREVLEKGRPDPQ